MLRLITEAATAFARDRTAKFTLNRIGASYV
jgi:hypothetical protein